MSINGLGGGAGLAGSSALHVLTAGGSYKLTGNLTVGQGQIAIFVSTTEPVSIDLNGFAIQGGGSGGGGIIADPFFVCPYLEIFDGYIRGMSGDGIYSTAARVLEVYDVHIDGAHQGILGSLNLVVESCRIERCALDGIVFSFTDSSPAALIVNDCEIVACGAAGVVLAGAGAGRNCTVSITDTDVQANLGPGIIIQASGGSGPDGMRIAATIQDVRAMSNQVGVIVEAPPSGGPVPATVTAQCEDIVCQQNALFGMHLIRVSADLIDCVCSENSGDGFFLEDVTGSIDNCTAMKNLGSGVHLVGTNCRMSVSEILSQSNGQSGIQLDGGVTGTPIADCDVRDQQVGIQVQSGGNLLVRNTATGNGVNYQVNSGTPAVIVGPADLEASHNPHANYSIP